MIPSFTNVLPSKLKEEKRALLMSLITRRKEKMACKIYRTYYSSFLLRKKKPSRSVLVLPCVNRNGWTNLTRMSCQKQHKTFLHLNIKLRYIQ